MRLRPLRETLLALAGAAADGNTAYAESWTDADVNDADEQKRTDAKITLPLSYLRRVSVIWPLRGFWILFHFHLR